MRPHKQKSIILVNNCKAIYDEELLKKAILWFASEPIQHIKKVFMYGRYPAVSIGTYKLHIHRLIVAYINDGIGRQFYVHHKDENRLNADIGNLEIMRADEHQRITNKGRKQSPEHVAKRTASMKKTRYENPELLK